MTRRIHSAWIVLLMSANLFMPSPENAAAGFLSAANWSDRLVELDPSRPMEYFLLAEEVADGQGPARDIELARHLFALAGVLAPDRLGESACLALADLADDGRSQRRLRALAALLARGGDAGSPVRTELREGTFDVDEATVAAVGDVLSFYRRGVGTRALSRLNQSNLHNLFAELSPLLPGRERFVEDLRGMRNNRPRVSDRDRIAMLHIEAALLAGRERTWSTDLVFNREQPLLEVDPSRLDEALNVDATRTRFRDGHWTH